MNHKKRLYRVITFLNRKELDFLDEMAKDLYFSQGIKIPRTKLIEIIVEMFREKGLMNKGRAEEELVMRLKKK